VPLLVYCPSFFPFYYVVSSLLISFTTLLAASSSLIFSAYCLIRSKPISLSRPLSFRLAASPFAWRKNAGFFHSRFYSFSISSLFLADVSEPQVPPFLQRLFLFSLLPDFDSLSCLSMRSFSRYFQIAGHQPIAHPTLTVHLRLLPPVRLCFLLSPPSNSRLRRRSFTMPATVSTPELPNCASKIPVRTW